MDVTDLVPGQLTVVGITEHIEVDVAAAFPEICVSVACLD